MNFDVEKIGEVRPNLVRRTGGGWLAVAPSGANLSVGVTAPTEEEARLKFRSVLGRWIKILAADGMKEAAN